MKASRCYHFYDKSHFRKWGDVCQLLLFPRFLIGCRGEERLIAPKILEPIKEGKAIITGTFSKEEANKIAEMIND